MATDKMKRAKDPATWLDHAKTYLRAAELLRDQHLGSFAEGADHDSNYWQDATLFLPTYLMGAYALELLYKAIILKSEAGIDPMTEWKGGKGHELAKLAKRAKVDGADIDFLSELQQFSIWKGRYPISSNGENLYAWDEKNGVPVEIKQFHLGGTPVKGKFKELNDQFDLALGTFSAVGRP